MAKLSDRIPLGPEDEGYREELRALEARAAKAEAELARDWYAQAHENLAAIEALRAESGALLERVKKAEAHSYAPGQVESYVRALAASRAQVAGLQQVFADMIAYVDCDIGGGNDTRALYTMAQHGLALTEPTAGHRLAALERAAEALARLYAGRDEHSEGMARLALAALAAAKEGR